ncbi:glycerophosphodiester phosphodiesterase [Geodermatophilus dictyosporus]|uniref:glycerophosphodiester phosphodiesterase n=1 Tax=Geodermatophilus dictyosporus TaxID=1523247 RepID=UPI003CC7A4AB
MDHRSGALPRALRHPARLDADRPPARRQAEADPPSGPLRRRDVARACAEGIGWIGPEAGHVTSTVCTAAHAAGVEVACYTVNRRHQRDALIADGVDAIFSDDPLYVAGDAGRRASDLFARQVWLPGMLPDTSRGRWSPVGSQRRSPGSPAGSSGSAECSRRPGRRPARAPPRTGRVAALPLRSGPCRYTVRVVEPRARTTSP